MDISYILDQTDFLTFQLYTTSKLEAAKKRRRKVQVIAPLIYLALGFWLYFRDRQENYKMTLILIAFAIIWYFFYPLLEGFSFRKRLLKYINVTYKDTLPMPVSMDWEQDFLVTRDEGAGNKIYYKDFEAINETGTYIFIKLNTGSSLILPKTKIENKEGLQNLLLQLSKELDIPYNLEAHWKWR
jgi:hypothetical protein